MLNCACMLAHSHCLWLQEDAGPEYAQEQKKGLYTLMTCMRDIRKSSDRTDNSFEPLRDTVRFCPLAILLARTNAAAGMIECPQARALHCAYSVNMFCQQSKLPHLYKFCLNITPCLQCTT